MKGIIDVHTHILPGIDDGAKNWDVCLDMINQSWDFGVSKIIATPHYLPWKKRISCEKIRSLCQEAEERFQQEWGRTMKIYPGSELYYHTDLLDKLDKGKVLTLADSRYILVEFRTDISYRELYQGMNHLMAAQYQPILAHVERYGCLRQQERLEELKTTGVLLQMNQGAFQKSFFDETGKWSRYQLLEGMIDFVASDMHNMKKRPPLSEKKMRWIYKNLSKRDLELLLKRKAKEICRH